MMQKIKTLLWSQIFIIYTRYLIGGAFVFASLIKIQGNRFTSESGAENPIDSAWHLFETLYASDLYWRFIGVGQLIAGFLLMTQRYAKLGAVVNLPIILNVFVITISYYFAFTPVITGLMLMANIILLLWDWNELKILFNLRPQIDHSIRLEQDNIWQIIGLMLFVITVLCRFFIGPFAVGIWTISCFLVGSIGLFMGLRNERKRKAMISKTVEEKL